ncbi:endonuclease/exonuclease/phosphatase family protein [Glutamicibacter sp. HZAU]|uniref:endonuclease/exonuclease/phosphatase family protein n=1 Tax=Glutamicibacter sp. HZAU TaxID=2049891 RepID=UPI0011AEB46A|nr:endonuclease/exonuclease/phosphatase family protein [Glutamicibacter sp. HZAU]
MIRRRMPYFGWPAGAVLILALVAGALPYLGFLGGGWIPKLQAFQPYLLLLPAAGLVIGLLGKKWMISGCLFVLLLCGTVPNVQLNAVEGQSGNDNSELVVLSFNALKAGADPEQLAEVISRTEPQILVLVETSEPLHRQLARRGALDDLGYRSHEAPSGGERDTVIFSKYPLQERVSDLDAEATGWYSLPVVDVQAPGGLVSVAGIHIYPPVGDAQRWERGLASVIDWSEQQKDNPVILAGDFNSVRSHPAFRALGDGFVQAGGFLPRPTWPAGRSFPPLIGIDHIVAKELNVTDSSSHAVGGSDHLAVSATVEFME